MWWCCRRDDRCGSHAGWRRRAMMEAISGRGRGWSVGMDAGVEDETGAAGDATVWGPRRLVGGWALDLSAGFAA